MKIGESRNSNPWVVARWNKEKGERERRKKVSSPYPFASPQFSPFLQFNIFLTLVGSVEAFVNARITKRFATRENTKFKTQKAKKKLLLRRTMRELVTKNPGFECSTVQPWFNLLDYIQEVFLFDEISILITPPFISYLSNKPSAVTRHIAGCLTKSLDSMFIGRVQTEIQSDHGYKF